MAGRRVDLRGTRQIMIHRKSDGGLHQSTGSQDREERTDLTVLTGMHHPPPPPFFYPFSLTHYSVLRFSGMSSLFPDYGRFSYYSIA